MTSEVRTWPNRIERRGIQERATIRKALSKKDDDNTARIHYITEEKEKKASFNTSGIYSALQQNIGSFLDYKSLANLVESSTKFKSAINSYPIDLSERQIDAKELIDYFQKGGNFNAVSLSIKLLPEDLPNLVPFLSKVKTLELIGDYSDIGNYALMLDSIFNLSLLSNCAMLTSLNLNNMHALNLNGLESCQQLNHIKFSQASIDDYSNLEKCNNLTFVELIDPKHDQNVTLNFFEVLSNITKLNKLNINTVQVYFLNSNLSKCTNLKEVEISDCPLLREITGLNECISLEKIRINNVSMYMDLSPLFTCRELQQVELLSTTGIFRDNYGINLDDFHFLTKLKKLVMESSQIEGKFSFEEFYSLEELILIRLNTNISTLILPQIGIQNANGSYSGLKKFKLIDLRDDSLSEVKNAEIIEEISLKNIPNLLNANFIRNCSKLKNLEINLCRKLSPGCLNGHEELEELTLANVPFTNLDFLAHKYPKLIKLNIETSREVYSHKFINNNIVSLYGLENCQSIKSLKILKIKLETYIDIASIAYLANLNELSIEAASYFDTSAVSINLDPIKQCKKLEILTLNDLKIEDDLFENMSELWKLNINSSYYTSLRMLLICPKLREIHLGGDYDTNLLPLKDLESLKIIYVAKIHNTNYEEFLKNSPKNLKRLTCSGWGMEYVLEKDEWIVISI